MLNQNINRNWLRELDKSQTKIQPNCKQQLHSVWLDQLRARKQALSNSNVSGPQLKLKKRTLTVAS